MLNIIFYNVYFACDETELHFVYIFPKYADIIIKYIYEALKEGIVTWYINMCLYVAYIKFKLVVCVFFKLKFFSNDLL